MLFCAFFLCTRDTSEIPIKEHGSEKVKDNSRSAE